MDFVQENLVPKIQHHLKDITKQMIDNPILAMIEVGIFTVEEWRAFAVQRYLAACYFEELLKAGIKKAKMCGEIEIMTALAANLRDEEGIDEKGNFLPTGSHEKWRQDFYNALGLDNQLLAAAVPLVETVEYSAALKDLIDNQELFVIVGAILLLEYSIPEEFKRLQIGRDKVFPDQFVLQSSDSIEDRKRKGHARLYIDHHILHDANSHYPDLEQAIVKSIKNSESLEQILAGMEIIKSAKQKFYNGCK